MIEVRIQKSEVRFGLFIFCLLFIVYCLLSSCGKKGDPTLKSYEKPEPPSGLRAIHRESEIILSWEFLKDKEPAIKGFHLMKSTGGDFEKISFLENNERSYIDRDFKIGSKYKYKIVSRNLKDVISVDSNIVDIEPKSPPAPPGTLSFKIDCDSLTLTWEGTGEGISYNIYKSEKRGLYSLMPVNKEPIKGTYFSDNFDIKKAIYYTIRSLAGGDIRSEGPASEELEINPSEFVPSTPVDLQVVVTEENVYLIWKEVPETWVGGYRIYRELNKEEGFILIGETQTPSFLDKNRPVKKRNYGVTAMGPSKEGPPAEIRDIIFIPQR